MSQEIEAKFRVSSHEPLRERLIALGGKPLGQVLETNSIFDRLDGSLRNKGMGLRVRLAEPTDGTASRATLTVKGPIEAGPFKSREELEVSVDAPAVLTRMLEMIGFVTMLQFRKRRESWQFGSCLVELDEVPYLGLFVEIEGPDEAAIGKAQKDLGLSGADYVKQSYPELLFQYCKEHKVTERLLELADAERE